MFRNCNKLQHWVCLSILEQVDLKHALQTHKLQDKQDDPSLSKHALQLAKLQDIVQARTEQSKNIASWIRTEMPYKTEQEQHQKFGQTTCLYDHQKCSGTATVGMLIHP
jgi:hypothetical protein